MRCDKELLTGLDLNLADLGIKRIFLQTHRTAEIESVSETWQVHADDIVFSFHAQHQHFDEFGKLVFGLNEPSKYCMYQNNNVAIGLIMHDKIAVDNHFPAQTYSCRLRRWRGYNVEFSETYLEALPC